MRYRVDDAQVRDEESGEFRRDLEGQTVKVVLRDTTTAAPIEDAVGDPIPGSNLVVTPLFTTPRFWVDTVDPSDLYLDWYVEATGARGPINFDAVLRDAASVAAQEAGASAGDAAAARAAAELAAELAVAPADTVVNTVLTNPATTAGAAFANKVTKGELAVKPEDYGAVGNGVADDWAALEAMMTVLRADSSDTPTNILLSQVYRIGRGSGRTAGLLLDRSNLTVTFLPGSMILMDNLNPSTGNGDQAHGIVITGDVGNIRLQDARVEWATAATARSQGDGIRVLGSATEASAPRDIHLAGHTVVRKAPQTGAVFMGAAGEIRLDDFFAQDTKGDGLHFNACHKGPIIGTVEGRNCGDDVLAFVTYFHASDPGTGPFNSPDLTTRNNVGARVGKVIAVGGPADGVRISGAQDVQIDSVTVTSKAAFGVIVDSAIANGTTILWTYLASRKVRIGTVEVASCNVGVIVRSANAPAWRTDDAYGLFDVQIARLRSSTHTSYGFNIESARGVVLEYADLGNQELRIQNFSHVRIVRAVNIQTLTVFGSSVAYTAPLSTVMDDHALHLGAEFRSGTISDIRNARLDLTSTNALAVGVVLQRIRDAKGFVKVVNHNRNNGAAPSAVQFLRVEESEFDLDITSDGNPAGSFTLGSGTAANARATEGLRIRAVWRSALGDGATAGTTIQGGGFGPLLTKYTLDYKHSAATTPAWAQSVL